MAREIVLCVDVDADTKAVYDAITTQEGLTSFWTPSVTARPEVGAELRFGFEPAPVDLEMTVTALEAGRRAQWACGGPWPYWGGTEVEWALTEAPESAGTRVVFGHRGWADDYDDAEFGSVAYTWALVLGALKRYAESGQPDPALS